MTLDLNQLKNVWYNWLVIKLKLKTYIFDLQSPILRKVNYILGVIHVNLQIV